MEANSKEREALIVSSEMAREIAGWKQPIDPEVIEWAMQDFNLQEALSDMHEIQTTGGYALSNFIHELERIARG